LTRVLVPAEISVAPRRDFDTVMTETPACVAMSFKRTMPLI
jgi:hypothetical protein